MNIRSGSLRSALAVLFAAAACRSSTLDSDAVPTSGESGLERVSLLAKGLE
jgi:hypothetical protein